jgi:hypothetical protein
MAMVGVWCCAGDWRLEVRSENTGAVCEVVGLAGGEDSLSGGVREFVRGPILVTEHVRSWMR